MERAFPCDRRRQASRGQRIEKASLAYLGESIPDKCYHLVKTVEPETEDDRVFLQITVHPTEPVISSRAALTIGGGLPRPFGMTEDQLTEMYEKYIDVPHDQTSHLKLPTGVGARNPRKPRIPSMLALNMRTGNGNIAEGGADDRGRAGHPSH